LTKSAGFFILLFMKRTAIFLLFLLPLYNCKKEKCNLVHESGSSLSIGIRKNEPLSIKLSLLSLDEYATIVRQAKHFRKSAIEKEAGTNDLIYSYLPELNYLGADSVFIESRNCLSQSYHKTKIQIWVNQ